MRGLAVGQIWENKHLSDKTHDVIIRWVSDDFVWFHYLDDDYLMESSISQFLNIRKAKSASPSLTDDQQIVLNQLCQIFMKQSYKSKMQAVYIFINKGMSDEFLRLDRNESNQVLAAFAEWGIE